MAAESIGKYVKSAISDIEWYDSGTELDKDVIFKFQHPSKRDYAVEQINKDVSSYQQQDPTSLLQEPAPTNTPAEGENAPIKEDDEDKKKPDWLTYAIIGLAAVALILLIIPKRKK